MSDQTLSSKIADSVRKLLSAADTPGASIALLHGEEMLFEEGVGYRNIARTQELWPDAQFYIYSVTKTMIAAAVLQLVESGRLGLDIAIQTYVEGLPLSMPLTLRQLLNHSSGLPDYGGLSTYNDALRAHPHDPWTSSRFLERTLQEKLLFAPGQGWSYSNIGYLMLVMLLEEMSDSSLAATLRRQLFTPLALKSTFVAHSLEDAHHLTPGYTTFLGDNDIPQDIRARYHPGWVSHGVVVSTATELARFFQALFGGRLISLATLGLMCEPVPVPHKHPHFKQPSYGLGLMLDPESPYGLIAGHGGGGPGYSAAALHVADVADRPLIITVLANRDHPDIAFEIAFNLLELVATQE